MLCCLNPDCEKPINQDTDKFCQSCGTELTAVLRHRFKIIKPLGRGGFGKTYLAEDTDKLKEKCVVKQLVYQAQGSHASKLIVDLFMREAEQLQQLWENPQIPSLFAYFEERGYFYLVQQYIEGQDLLKELKADGCFNDKKIQSLLQDLLPVFEAIHQRKVIHRDIKPENIMRRGSDGKLILIDFGVSKQLSKSIVSIAGTIVGSLGYAAPEQMESGIAHANSDLYSLGASCFHLMTGINPWSLWKMQGYGWLSEWRKHLQQPISAELGQVLDKLLQIEPTDRYQTANEVLTDLVKNPEPAPAENLRQYEAELKKIVRSVYPLDDYVREGLKQLQQSLGLLDADVARIEQPILKQAEVERQERKKQQAEAKRQEQLRQKAEANRQEQLRQQEKARQQTPISPTSSSQASSPAPQKKNRRQFLTLVAFGGVGLGSVLAWEAIKNSSTSSDSPEASPLLSSSSNLNSFEFEVVSVDEVGSITNRKQEQAQFFAEELDSSTTLEMVEIPEGTFTMGSPSSEEERDDDEAPQHEVTLSTFYLGKYPVTQAQWEVIMGSNPSNFKGANLPVEQVSWEDAVGFCQKLSQESGKDYRLPSEAEWEYACRVGTTTPFYFGETITPKLVNYDGNYTYGSVSKGEFREQTTDVGSFPPNTFGLYDMHGTVWEWCQDTWHDNYTGAPTDGTAWINKNTSKRVIRGGSWLCNPRYCRSANRLRNDPGDRNLYVGFRVALF
ncbi:SUMF1/EgtB/PvdO family nonheme iron enzyme (plasmid) [Acaryochloris sp. 'Moss Beach']|nr:SUMF1/EgtB/PvdO family nonheme iron enzyme [Acaryochloris sp. 'Moss Beach']